jgi:hypothetical protein
MIEQLIAAAAGSGGGGGGGSGGLLKGSSIGEWGSFLLGSEKNTGGTQTVKPNITKEGMDRLLQQILESTQGLGSVTMGQKTAGMYGSTTNQMMLNDLLVRAAGELAARQAGVTTTSEQRVEEEGLFDKIGNLFGW